MCWLMLFALQVQFFRTLDDALKKGSSEDQEVAQPKYTELLRVGTLLCTGGEGDSALSLCLLY